MKRAERRQQKDRIKKKVAREFKDLIDPKDRRYIVSEVPEKVIGKLAQVHGAKCSCRMCGNPRRYGKGKDALTMQELKHKPFKEDLE
jgi:hypothetical protein